MHSGGRRATSSRNPVREPLVTCEVLCNPHGRLGVVLPIQ